MPHQGVVLQRSLFCFYILLLVSSKIVESTPSSKQESDSKTKAAQDTRTVPLSTSSIHRTSEVLKPSQVRNRRSNLLTEKEQFIDDNPGLDSAFLYSDQIMQNLLKTHSPKPLNYARSNFFLNLLKPRTTRYNAWDDHSLMHFGKRSTEDVSNVDKVLVKRSADLWSPNNVMHFGKKSDSSAEENGVLQEGTIDVPNFKADDKAKSEEITSDASWKDDPNSDVETLEKKSPDPWHSMMSFGKKSQTSSLDDSKLEFDKKDDPWHNKMSFGKRFENPWDHNTMHFGKRDEPWHNMMSFGKKSDPWHSMMSFGKKSDPWHNMMSFGKRTENPWDHNTLHFGKRDDPWHNMMSFGKRLENPWDHNTLHFGKRDEPWHNMMSFGKKSDPWHSMMSFGKKSDNPWDHNTLHFGKRDAPWHNMMSFGKRSEISDPVDLEKRDEPWHNMMSFGKKSDNLENNNTLSADKREEPWHDMMSFGKKSDNDFGEHFTLHFGKRDEPWHNMMSFGKRSDNPWDHNTLHFGKRDEPWHNMMSFGKKSDNPWDHNTLHFGKREEPWHSMMSFGKKSDNPWDHNTLHFGKRDEPWHNMMSFGKKSDNPWDHNTLHFGKREEPWHSMMSFGKKSDNPWDHNTLHFGKREEPWHNMMSFGKKSDDPWHSMMSFGKRSNGLPEDDLLEDFGRHSDPWQDYNAMVFYKKSDPWDHNTLHFGKKSNEGSDPTLPTQKDENADIKHIQKRSVDMWNDLDAEQFEKKSDPWESHNTMHFGKKSDPWESHNTMHFGKKSESEDTENLINADKKFDWDHNTLHFGKKSEPWDNHNTMHFGKKRDPWDYHNTMHFGKKRDPWDYHNTMHFGKRDPWDYHNTMHFGKRDPWDYHNTMHFGKRSDGNLKESNTVLQKDTEIKKKTENNNIDEAENEVTVKKRSSENLKSNSKLDNNHEISKESNHGNEKLTVQSRIIKRSLKSTKSIDEKDALLINDKEEFGAFKAVANEEQNQKDHKQNKTHISENDKSRITKRSIGSASFDTQSNELSENIDPNAETLEEFSKDDFPDNVLHFGKRSVDDSERMGKQYVTPWFDGSMAKRFDDYYWDNHNTMHFGKKSDPWESHGTLHFGKRSNPWEEHSTMHFGKRDPWDYHSTLHFGKKFDPWEGHAKMHFGKRTSDWDHNVMHFGKRGDLTTEDLQNIISSEELLNLLSDPAKLKDILEEKYDQQDIKESLENLDAVINSELKDENVPFEEKYLLLKSYLKPIIKVILGKQAGRNSLLENYFPYLEQVSDADVNDNELNRDRDGIFGLQGTVPDRSIMNDINYDELLPKEIEDLDGVEYGNENSKLTEYLKDYKNFLKSKRGNLGKPELKRYFVPFQGPKSIVYPHAWFASQIRRSTLPRTTEYARRMEMRMAEKKEDPFNSYMHFGRR